LRFRVESLLESADLSTAEGRARAAGHALDVVAEHPDDLVRDEYLMEIADRCHFEPQRLRDRLEELRRAPRPARPPGPSPRTDRGAGERSNGTAPSDGCSDGSGRRAGVGSPPRREFRPGLEALRLAVHRPEEMSGRLEALLFEDDVQRAAFAALMDAETLREAIDGAAPEVADLLVRISVEQPLPGSDPDEVVDHLVRVAAAREIARLEAASRSSESARSERAEGVALLHALDDSISPAEAREGLVAWLVVRAGKKHEEPGA
ncbi:MAG: hypothetical protein JO368_10765, partial [Acidimicrobiales bacterium]|nr:hypothetical protein [Acidimicrobiales bacterium]